MASQGSKKARKHFSLLEKLEILRAVDEKTETKTQVARRYGISKSTLSTILSQRIELEKASCSHLRGRRCKNEEFDRKIFEWFMNARANFLPVSGPILQEKAREEAAKFGMTCFKASDGWLEKFKARWGIVSFKATGVRSGVDSKVEEEWHLKLKTLISGYDPKDIFNADEVGLFFNLLPDRTLTLKGEKCYGGRRSSERFTILLCANSDGSEKLQPIVIGKFASPGCFQNVKQLPCPYRSDAKSWMTSSLFMEWLQYIDARMRAQDRKILMFIDCCRAHMFDGVKLSNVRVIFFPPNCTNKLQPMGQGIITAVKGHYRKALISCLLRQIDRKAGCVSFSTWNVLEAMHRLCFVWDECIDGTAIENCFVKAGFLYGSTDVPYQDIVTPCVDCDDWNTLKELGMNLEGISFQDFVEVDDNLEVADEWDCEAIDHQDHGSDEEDDVGDDTPPLKCPKTLEVSAALDTLRSFILASENANVSMRLFQQLEFGVMEDLSKVIKQSTVC